jgi:hypothetical protein
MLRSGPILKTVATGLTITFTAVTLYGVHEQTIEHGEHHVFIPVLFRLQNGTAVEGTATINIPPPIVISAG